MIGLGGRGSGVDSMAFLQELLAVVNDPKKVEEHLEKIRQERDGAKAAIAALDKARADHDAREQELRDREAELAKRARGVEDGWGQLLSGQTMLNDSIKRHKSEAALTKTALDDRAAAITTAHDGLDKRAKLVADSEKAVEEARCRLADKEVELAKRETELATKESQLADSRKALTDRWRALQQLMRNEQ
jgi:chromosome segregation ATPase